MVVLIKTFIDVSLSVFLALFGNALFIWQLGRQDHMFCVLSGKVKKPKWQADKVYNKNQVWKEWKCNKNDKTLRNLW